MNIEGRTGVEVRFVFRIFKFARVVRFVRWVERRTERRWRVRERVEWREESLEEVEDC